MAGLGSIARLSLSLLLLSPVYAQSQTPAVAIEARWGQASALLGSLFVVQGGKTQGTSGGGYTYTSAPSYGDMYALDLSAPFSTASPPWKAISADPSGAAAPAVSFHTLSPINSSALLLFGGDGSPTVPVQRNNDSAYIVHIGSNSSTAAYNRVSSTWAEPMRRVYHTSESNTDGSIWIMGGEKADGSNILLDELWSLNINATSPTFTLGSAPPSNLVGSTSTLLSDGTLLLLGGMNSSGQLQSMQQIHSLSTHTHNWAQTGTQASSQTLSRRQQASTTTFPAPRRNHVAVSLPNKRVFIQGGASADLSVAYSDAWILDWSVEPPMWTELTSSTGPGARYGHAAVAYGRQVILAFGWSGGNAADSNVHVFDATSLTSSSQGSWSGGSWTSSYKPDQQASQQSSGSTGNAGSSSDANGSSTSSGGTAGTSSTDQTTSGSSPTDAGFPVATAVPTTSSGNSDNQGSSEGMKAGTAIGTLVGVGLVLGAGYAVYKKRSAPNDWRRGDGAAGLLGRESDDPSQGEKGYTQPYGRPEDSGLAANATYASRKRGRTEASIWTMGDVGHAMEGSGPHFKERLAILTGIGKRDSQTAPRFDMLADEMDGTSIDQFMTQIPSPYEEEATSPSWDDRQLREHSYVNVHDQEVYPEGVGHMYDLAEADEEFTPSPFEDADDIHTPSGPSSRAGFFAVAGAALAGKAIYGQVGAHDAEVYAEKTPDLESGGAAANRVSMLSLSNSSKSQSRDEYSQAYDSHSPNGITSFSDASLTSLRGPATGSIGRAKRSPSWWERFVGGSLLERSISGRSLATSQSSLPIRDPALPPVVGLESIVETTRSREASQADDPFGDANRVPRYTDEMGRRITPIGEDAASLSSYRHGRAVSSTGSTRTTTSSHFDARFQNMDVVQRARTGSSMRSGSIRTGSTMSDTESEAALSRNPSTLRPQNASLYDTRIPETVVWQPQGAGDRLANVSEKDEAAPGPETLKRLSNVSETPSVTPLTTKRARQNPLMTSALFPVPAVTRKPVPALVEGSGTVRDRVKALEQHAESADSSLLSPWTASLSSLASSHSLTTVSSPDIAKTERPVSVFDASSISTASKKVKYTHGLVPKAQLFVANPDSSRRSDNSTGQSS